MKEADDKTEEAKVALNYLEECKQKEQDFIDRTVDDLPAEVTKEELGNKLRATCFSSPKLRMAVAGREPMPAIKENGAPQHT